MNPEKFFTTVRSASNAGEVGEFVAERVRQAEATSQPMQFVDGDGNRVTYNFIHPESRVTARTRKLFSRGFHVNDPAVYEQFAADAHALAQADAAPDDLLLGVVQTTMLAYFGSQREDQVMRKKLHGGLIRGSKGTDLATMKDQGVAQCTEFTAVSHNLCKLAGMPSIFMSGTVRIGQELYGHNWQIVRHSGSQRIFDVANPNVEIHENVQSLYPFTGEVSALDVLCGVPTTLYRQAGGRKQRFEYEITPTYPSTQEGFCELRKRGLGAYMTPEQLHSMALMDAAMNLAKSSFYAQDAAQG